MQACVVAGEVLRQGALGARLQPLQGLQKVGQRGLFVAATDAVAGVVGRIVERLKLEFVAFAHQFVDALLRVLKALLACTRQLDAALERGQGLLQALLAAFHFFDDALELGQRRLEVGRRLGLYRSGFLGHARSSGIWPKLTQAGGGVNLLARRPQSGLMSHPLAGSCRMEVHTFFLILLAILLGARILGELAARLGAPPVIGELLAGVILGPSLLGWVEPTAVISLLAEIGIILLLFEIGLETDVMRLIKTGLKSVAVAIAGVILPFVSGFAASYLLFQLDLLAALFIGGTLTATSIGITVRVLADLKRQRSREAEIVLGAAVLDDVIGVVLLALLYEVSTGGGVSLGNTGKVALFIVMFMVLAPVAARIMAEAIRRFEPVSQIPGLIPTTVVSLVLLFAWLAHAVGAPELLGGFAAGLALSRWFAFPAGSMQRDAGFAQRIERELRPIVHLFTPIFFVTVGLSLNFRAIDWASPFIWQFSLALFTIAFVTKLVAGFVVREKFTVRVAIGLAMTPRGEVGLIFAELGRAAGIFNNEIYAATVIVIALTTLLPPFLLKAWYARTAAPVRT